MRGGRLRRDEARGRWVLLAPERVFALDDTAAAVLALCDGVRDRAAIVSELASRYQAPQEVIERDVDAMLDDLLLKKVLDA